MKNITPAKFRCGLGQCPGVFDLEDGRIAVRGAWMFADESRSFGVPVPTVHEFNVTLPKELILALAADLMKGEKA